MYESKGMVFLAFDPRAEENRRYGSKTIVFVDEIHRFNKAQQDAFLPFVEKGSIILIGATTENPSFEINGALLSRCKVFVLLGWIRKEVCQRGSRVRRLSTWDTNDKMVVLALFPQ